MSDNELIKNAMNSINGIKPLTLLNENNESVSMTLDELIDHINADHSEDFSRYFHNDWLDGLVNFGGGLRVVFDVGQKFYWNDPDNDLCSKFVTLAEKVVVEVADEIMRCEEGEFPLNELNPIIDTENRPYKQIGNRWIYINVDETSSYSYFTTDLDGNELDSFATVEECEEAIEKENGVCKYCGGNCPDDEDNACDGYQGDIDGLYSK